MADDAKENVEQFRQAGGHAILHTLYNQSLKNDVDFFVEYFVIDLIFEEGKCVGVIAWCLEDGKIHLFQSHMVILATG